MKRKIKRSNLRADISTLPEFANKRQRINIIANNADIYNFGVNKNLVNVITRRLAKRNNLNISN